MEPNAFIGRKTKPTDADVSKVLGSSKALWDQVIDELKKECPTKEWNSYSLKAGWSLKLKKKDRTILYLAPFAGGFHVSFALGDKAVKSARESQLPKSMLKLIAEARKYAEGTAVRFNVTNEADVGAVKTLAAIKIAN